MGIKNNRSKTTGENTRARITLELLEDGENSKEQKETILSPCCLVIAKDGKKSGYFVRVLTGDDPKDERATIGLLMTIEGVYRQIASRLMRNANKDAPLIDPFPEFANTDGGGGGNT